MPPKKSFPSQMARYSDLFEKLMDAVLLLDLENFKILDANPAAEAFFDLKRDAFLKLPVTQWVTSYERSTLEQEFKKAIQEEKPCEYSGEFKNSKDVTLIAKVVICPLKLSDESRVLQLILKNITEEHRAKHEAVSHLIKIMEMTQKLELMSHTDEMTKLYNFRYFKEKLAEEHARSCRYDLVYSILFCDLDHFKNYNDRNGHPAGDDLLKKLAAIMSSASRETDFVARYGGEEFAIICPETSPENAAVLAERLRAQIAQFPFDFGNGQPLGKVTISIGIAGFPKNGKSTEDVLQAADQAAYQSKKNGRNRVTLAE